MTTFQLRLPALRRGNAFRAASALVRLCRLRNLLQPPCPPIYGPVNVKYHFRRT